MTTVDAAVVRYLVPAGALTAWRRLRAAMADQAPPCAASPDLWAEALDVATVVAGCRGCPVRHPCGLYADAARETSGVRAGIDRTRRPVHNDTRS